MEYRVLAEAWDRHLSRLAAGLREPAPLPPLIVVYDNGALNIRDGNHRYEAQPTGFWDRAPRPTVGRLRRVLAQLDISKTAPSPWQLRKMKPVTAHLPKGALKSDSVRAMIAPHPIGSVYHELRRSH